MLFKGTIIHKTNEPFAIVWANYGDLRSKASRIAYLKLCQPYFPDLPIILVSEDEEGNPIYFGDTTLVTWLESQHALHLEWTNYGN